MQQLPWKLLSVPADGRCALHATALACGYRSVRTGNDVGGEIRSELLAFYAGTHAARLIAALFASGDFAADEAVEGFGGSHIANPLYFSDFIRERSPWIKDVVACECGGGEQVGLSGRQTCPHARVVSFVHRRTKHARTTTSVLRRDAVVFLNCSSHWYVLLPYERSIGL